LSLSSAAPETARKPIRVFVAGGTGLIGRRLVSALSARGDSVVLLTRDPSRVVPAPGVEAVRGDPTEPGDWSARVAGCAAVVNLAGENLFARRWSAEFKARLHDSRLRSTANIAAAIAGAPETERPRVLIQGSAIGFYGDSEVAEFTEESAPDPAQAGDFLVALCREWEAAAAPASAAGCAVTLLRTGIVLDPAGGALAELLPVFRWFVGGPVGSGRQWMSWIHRDDQTGLILWAVDSALGGRPLAGPLNATAPEPATNSRFSKALGAALGRPSFLWAPGFALRLALGEVAGTVLGGQRVLPARALKLGYRFRFPSLDAALKDLLAG
jgi:uncharacterized protein (TIGR01777 family)